MTEKYKNKYRITTTRLQTWDYKRSALYFITICTQNREPFFGNVVNGEMQLSDIGKIAHAEWLRTFDMRPDMNLSKHAFVVMPNHFHAIIGIGENEYNKALVKKDKPQNQFGTQSKNLASIIRGFKISVTRNARIINPEFAWQALFHDHIIRNQKAYQNISRYIINNPLKWHEDKFYSNKS